VLVIALGKLLRRPVVLKLTSSGPQGIQQAASALPMTRIAAPLLRKVDAVVATTRETRAEAVAFGIPVSRVHVLGNGVNAHAFRPHPDEERARLRSEIGIDASGMMAFVGRLSSEKNPDGLLRCWKLAFPRLPTGWKLVLVGEGPMRDRLGSCVDTEGLSASVVFAGFQTNVEAWMAAADIFVLASHNEGLSIAMLEAMASGLPIVSTRVSGSIETLEETGAGLVVDVGQMDQLADALVRLAADPTLRKQMGLAGRAVIVKRYSIESVSARHERLYRGLLAEKTNGRRVA
jgi:glycosyltransferase involved in cell wall biosynthesis